MRCILKKKLLGLGDVKVIRVRAKGSTHFLLTPEEMKAVITSVGDNAYVLYSYYRTGYFTESHDFDDAAVAEVIGWGEKKVQKYRLILEGANLFCKTRYGTKAEGITKVFVGADVVALHKAGLPADILDGNALTKIKRELGITTTQELIMQVSAVVAEYDNNPEKYK